MPTVSFNCVLVMPAFIAAAKPCTGTQRPIVHGCGIRQFQTGSVTLSSQLSSAALGSLTCRRHCVSQATGFVTLQLGADQSDMMVKKHCQQAVFKCILLRHRHGQTKHGNKRGKKRGKKHGTCRISATSGPTKWMPSTLSVLASTTTLMKPLPSLSVNESLNALQVQDKQ